MRRTEDEDIPNMSCCVSKGSKFHPSLLFRSAKHLSFAGQTYFASQYPKPLAFLLLLVIALVRPIGAQDAEPEIIIVLGAAGDPEYEVQFRSAAEELVQALGHAPIVIDGTQPLQEGDESDRERLVKLLQSDRSDRPLWLFLVGHGTFQQNVSKFNLRGPDITPVELRDALSQWNGPQLIVIAASSSAPFLQTLSSEGRIVISATKSGAEVNFSRFGISFARALLDPATDIDHDESISVLEAFLSASYRVQMFYKENARLATEQALLDDNGDGKGTPATFFRGLRGQQTASGALNVDGQLARKLILVLAPQEMLLSPEQLAARQRIESQIDSLRSQRDSMSADDYYRQLEELFSQIGSILHLK